MTELAEYERRIAYALERIGRGVDVLTSRPAAVAAARSRKAASKAGPASGPLAPPAVNAGAFAITYRSVTPLRASAAAVPAQSPGCSPAPLGSQAATTS